MCKSRKGNGKKWEMIKGNYRPSSSVSRALNEDSADALSLSATIFALVSKNEENTKQRG